MNFTETEKLSNDEIAAIRRLWNDSYPSVIEHRTIEETISYVGALVKARHVIVREANDVVAWFADFDRDQRRFFVMIVDKRFKRRGLGSQLLDFSKKENDHLYGWIVLNEEYKLIDGSHYSSPLSFYEKNGFIILPEVKSPTNILDAVLIKWEK